MAADSRPADGHRIVRSLLESRKPGPEWLEEVREHRSRTGVPLFGEMVRLLTHLRLGELEAEETWVRILAHRDELASRLGRDVGLAMALFDWFVNIEQRFKEPVIVERAQLERTEKSAMTDWLTALYNRGAFNSAAHRELRRAQRYRQQLSLVLFDLDDFKLVNDRFGHEKGDLVLREIGLLLRRSVRDVDVAARYGGEEFAVLLPETGRLGARAVAERVRAALARHGVLRDEGCDEPPVTVSAGIAVYPEDGEELGDLLRQADVALYRAKAEGKNTIVSEWEERRLARRIALDGTRTRVSYRRSGESRTLVGSARDISRTGVGLVLPESCEVGQLLEMSLDGPAMPASRNLFGRVVRYQESRGGQAGLAYDVGVALDEPSCREAAAAIETYFAGRRDGDSKERSAAP